jgi:ribosomal protein S18 acetylase RimI-like enzyme
MNPYPPRRPGTIKLPEGLTIRGYRDGDEAAVIALVRELQIHEGQYIDRLKPPDTIGPWYVEALIDEVAKNKGSFLVAERDGLVVGYATLLAEMSSRDEKDEIDYSYSYVGDLAVLYAHRGLGIGKALLEECERLARAAGQKWLRLGVIAENRGARRFYERFGLEERFLTLEKRLD